MRAPSFPIILLIEMLYIVHYSNNLLIQNKETFPKVKTIVFLMKPKLLLWDFCCPKFLLRKTHWLDFSVMFSTCISGVLISALRQFLYKSLLNVYLHYLFLSPLQDRHCKFLITQTFLLLLVLPPRIYSTGTKISLFFLRQTPTEQWGASRELRM